MKMHSQTTTRGKMSRATRAESIRYRHDLNTDRQMKPHEATSIAERKQSRDERRTARGRNTKYNKWQTPVSERTYERQRAAERPDAESAARESRRQVPVRRKCALPFCCQSSFPAASCQPAVRCASAAFPQRQPPPCCTAFSAARAVPPADSWLNTAGCQPARPDFRCR